MEQPFSAVTDARLRALAERGTVRRYRRGTVLMEEGDAGGTLLIVLAGRLRAYSSSRNGSTREITYGVYGPGDLVGEMSLDGKPRSASVITLEASACSVLARETVLQHIAAQPEFAFDLLT